MTEDDRFYQVVLIWVRDAETFERYEHGRRVTGGLVDVGAERADDVSVRSNVVVDFISRPSLSRTT